MSQSREPGLKPVVIKADAGWKLRKMARKMETCDLDYTVRKSLGEFELPAVNMTKHGHIIDCLRRIAEPCVIEIVDKTLEDAELELFESFKATLEQADDDYLVGLINDGYYPSDWAGYNEIMNASIDDDSGCIVLYCKVPEANDGK